MSVPMDQMPPDTEEMPEDPMGEDMQDMTPDMTQGIPPEWQVIIEDLQGRGVDVSHIVNLLQQVDSPNLVDSIDDSTLSQLSHVTWSEYEIDKESRSEWEDEYDEFLKLAEQAVEHKSYPWEGAANVKYPALTKAGIRFNARALPALIPGGQIAKAKVLGKDEDGQKAQRKSRVEGHLNWQLLHEITEWQDGMDRLLLMNPFVGTSFKKTYYDRTLQRNVSDLVTAKDLVVNYDAPSFERAPRKTEKFELYPHEVVEHQREGIFADIDVLEGYEGDRYAPEGFIEQHRRFDLDDDGYQEPVIVTMHERTRQVMRVVAGFDEDGIEVDDATGQLMRIAPVEYYTKYGFIPNPKSAVYDWGYGHLMRSLQGAMDTSMNQMLDAAHLANAPGGWIGREMRIKGGTVRKRPGEYRQLPVPGDDIRRGVVTDQFPGPNQQSFALVEFLKGEIDDLGSLQAVLEGDVPANSQPTTVMALIEQSLQPVRAIFKRLHASLSDELEKLFRLNKRYMEIEQYFEFVDTGEAERILLDDYQDSDMGIVPVSDPTVLGDQEKLAKAEALMQFVGDPMINQQELKRRYFEATKQEDIDQLFVEEPPDPSPEQQKEMAEIDKMNREIALKEQMAPFERMKTYADALEAIASAEGEEKGQQLAVYDRFIKAMQVELEAIRDASQQRAMGGMGEPPRDRAGQGVSPGAGGRATPSPRGNTGGGGQPV